MKLGFILKTTNSGDGEAFSINKEESWAKYATEVRSYIKELHNFDGTSKTVILVRFHGSDGYMISIIKARPDGSGRENDNTAAWIHFPAKIKISAKEVCSIIPSNPNGAIRYLSRHQLQIVPRYLHCGLPCSYRMHLHTILTCSQCCTD